MSKLVVIFFFVFSHLICADNFKIFRNMKLAQFNILQSVGKDMDIYRDIKAQLMSN